MCSHLQLEDTLGSGGAGTRWRLGSHRVQGTGPQVQLLLPSQECGPSVR